MFFNRNRYSRDVGRFPSKLVSRLVGVLSLSALVLGISFGIMFISRTNPDNLISFTSPILTKFGVNIDRVAEVAGIISVNLFENNDNSEEDDVSNKSDSSSSKKESTPTKAEPSEVEESLEMFELAIFADIHDDKDNLASAISKVKGLGITDIIVIGDLTDFGEPQKLREIKTILDSSDLNYYILPGDRDLYQSVGPSNFLEVFENNYFVLDFNGYKFVGLDNSQNYTTINSNLVTKFESDVANADFIILSQPIYHPTLNLVMGIVNGEEIYLVKQQASYLLKILQDSNVKAVFSADQHHSSINNDVSRPDLKHIVVGALTGKRNLQTPRFSVLTIFNDGEFEIEDVIL